MPNGGTPQETFVRGFRERVVAAGRPGQQIVDEDGIVALVGRGPDTLDGRVLVTDDRAAQRLGALLPVLHARVLNVFAGAVECRRLLLEAGGYRAEECTAMVCEDIDAIAAPTFPDGLTVGPVEQTRQPSGGVALADAAASALRADPTVAPTTDLDGFVDYLCMVPNARFLAAVDDHGLVRATSAAAIFGATAGVFFVNTDPDWRGRGVGTAMTAAALHAAVDAGADTACLDASPLGLSIYRRLGFSEVSSNTLFVRKG